MPDPALWLGLKARVADPDPAGQRIVDQRVRQVDQLAHRAAPAELPVANDGDAVGHLLAPALEPRVSELLDVGHGVLLLLLLGDDGGAPRQSVSSGR